ncbi:MAG: hypothetical protein GF418_07940 [Chitinivibrionales bacterium]|nr:hypothetical protein [Chitinivibrionales bacterium]MBD3395543.1 hypothetical protein [Chitinivibrionales bacterium]
MHSGHTDEVVQDLRHQINSLRNDLSRARTSSGTISSWSIEGRLSRLEREREFLEKLLNRRRQPA